jgi:hypothetical protein
MREKEELQPRIYRVCTEGDLKISRKSSHSKIGADENAPKPSPFGFLSVMIRAIRG